MTRPPLSRGSGLCVLSNCGHHLFLLKRFSCSQLSVRLVQLFIPQNLHCLNHSTRPPTPMTDMMSTINTSGESPLIPVFISSLKRPRAPVRKPIPIIRGANRFCVLLSSLLVTDLPLDSFRAYPCYTVRLHVVSMRESDKTQPTSAARASILYQAGIHNQNQTISFLQSRSLLP